MSVARIVMKPGVRVRDIRPEMVLGITIAAGCWGWLGLTTLTVTSVNDSKHGPNSLHYKGAAADLRTKDIGQAGDPQNAPRRAVLDRLVSSLCASLGADFDVVLENFGGPNEHIHVEYDPR